MKYENENNSRQNRMERTVPKMTEERELNIGAVKVYDFGRVRLHCYETKDALADECFAFETETGLVVLEASGFHESLREWADYLKERSKPIDGVLLSYHPAGGEYFGGADIYSTEKAVCAAGEGGAIRSLMDGFAQAFGEAFDTVAPMPTHMMQAGKINIGGIEFRIIECGDAFEVEIPEIHVMYTHMLGADCHSILAGQEHMDALLQTLEGYKEKKYSLILSSHHTPEPLSAVDTKIEYIKTARKLAADCTSAEAFRCEMEKRFPHYSGMNYLEMTAGMLY